MSGEQDAVDVIDSGIASAISEFARAKGHDIVQTYFSDYLAFSRAAMVQLLRKIDSSDYVGVELLAHSLQSASLQVGAHKLAVALGKIEQAGQKRLLDQLNADATAQLISLHAEVQEVLAAIVKNPDKWLGSTE